MSGLTPQLLLAAYASGVFPMAESRRDPTLYWIDPDLRGLLPLDRFHIPRRLRRTLRAQPFGVRCDTEFAAVVRACAQRTPSRSETWINADIELLYTALHDMNFAHSIECWNDGELVGGLYGVAMGAAFFGESMFSRETDASKVALCHLVARLRAGGYLLLDTQFVTDHLRRFGAIEVSRRRYRSALSRALKAEASFYPDLSAADFDAFVQSTTQTS